jgi:nucleoside 2-deoxyribosyltransferase
MKVYLAGPIFQRTDQECIAWREEAKQQLNGIKTVDPMDRDYREKTDELYTQIVEEDKAFIDSCDVVLVYHDRPSVGTSMEVLYAWERDIQVVAVCPEEKVSPWLLYHAHKICTSLEEATQYIKDFSKKKNNN